MTNSASAWPHLNHINQQKSPVTQGSPVPTPTQSNGTLGSGFDGSRTLAVIQKGSAECRAEGKLSQQAVTSYSSRGLMGGGERASSTTGTSHEGPLKVTVRWSRWRAPLRNLVTNP